MKNAVLPSMYQRGCLTNASSATSVPMFAPMPLSDLFLLRQKEVAAAPAGFTTKAAIGVKDMQFRLAISPYDCTGCGNCAQVCPAKEKALVMEPLASQLGQDALWQYVQSLPPKNNPLKPLYRQRQPVRTAAAGILRRLRRLSGNRLCQTCYPTEWRQTDDR